MALLALSACSLSLPQHALIAVSANHAIKGIRDLTYAEMREDYDHHGGAGMSEHTRQELDAKWDGKILAIHTARDLAEEYAATITQADASGDKSVLVPVVRRLITHWVDVQAVADDLGVPFPQPPARLLKFLESNTR